MKWPDWRERTGTELSFSLPQEELKKNKETSTASKPTATQTLEKAEDRGVELELMQVIRKLKLAPNTQAFLFTKGLTSQVNGKNLPT